MNPGSLLYRSIDGTVRVTHCSNQFSKYPLTDRPVKEMTSLVCPVSRDNRGRNTIFGIKIFLEFRNVPPHTYEVLLRYALHSVEAAIIWTLRF